MEIPVIFFKAVILCLITATFYLTVTLFWLFKRRTNNQWLSMLIVDYILISFLFQPTFIKEISGIFRCRMLDGRTYIMSSLDGSCEDDVYKLWKNSFSIPLLLFWVGFFPLICLGKLVINSKKLTESQLKLFFGFFYFGYKPNFYFWEFVIMFRKILMILSSLIPEERLFTKGYVVLFLNAGSGFLQNQKCPFIDPALNSLEIKANIASMITILLGLFYLTNLSEKAQAFCFALIVIVNTFFLLNWVKFVFYVTFKTINEHHIIKKFCPQLPTKILVFIKGSSILNCFCLII